MIFFCYGNVEVVVKRVDEKLEILHYTRGCDSNLRAWVKDKIKQRFTGS